MKKSIESLKKETAAAAELCEKWMLSHIQSKNLLNSKITDPVSYYKWPLTLIGRGKKDEAAKLLQWINEQCLSENGDYISNRSGFHKEFHTYSTLWIVLAAIKLGDTVLVERLLKFILKFQNEKTGGLATFPSEANMTTEDPVSAAFLGMVACELKDKDLADKLFNYFENLYALQTEDDKFWLRLNNEGALIKSYNSDVDPKTYFISIGKEDECYYFLGAACYFMARYMEVFDAKSLPLARKYTSLLEKAGGKSLSTIWAAKAAPGCTALYSLTSEDYFLEIAQPVIRAVLQGQSDKGYWIKNNNPWVTVSAEQCYWLTDISSRL